MKSYSNELTVRRNEAFTIDRLLRNKDGSPYIISSKLQNPYFLITVTSTNYSVSNRYIKNYWLDLSDFPRFLVTVPERRDVDWNNFSSQIETDRIYYRNGKYRYYSGRSSDVDPYGWIDYDCRLVKSFLPADTSKWVDQSYLYSIRLVSGVKTDVLLLSLWDMYVKDNVPSKWKDESGKLTEEGITNVYNVLLDKNSDCVKDIILGYPIQNIDFFVDILGPTKLTVLSDLIGGING